MSRADISVLSHEVGDFAEADAHYELHGTDAEAEREGTHHVQDREQEVGQGLDAAGLTMGLMGFTQAQQPVSQPAPSQRYQETVRESFEDEPQRDEREVEYEASQLLRGSADEKQHAAPESQELHESQPHGMRLRSNSLNSASIVSTHSDRSSHRGSAAKAQPNRMKYSGITDIKISHKLKPGDVHLARPIPSAGASVNPATRKAPVSAGSRPLRTPSPMTRGTGSHSTGKRPSSTSHSRPTSSGAAVVTPGTGHSKGRVISTGGSVLKKHSKDKSTPGSVPRRQSLMY